jgi:serine phosphatase RsbU (regulator of sigma subunit)
MTSSRGYDAHAQAAASAASPTPESNPPRNDAVTVLLVEDDDGDALLVEDLLAETLERARVSRVRTFADALGKLDAGVDCVLLDLQLPDAAGLDTVMRLRARAPDISLVVLTGLDDEAAGAAAVDAGAQDYLVKGKVEGDQLARAIRYSISRRQATDAQHQLRMAEAQSREVARLERGLAPKPLIDEGSVWISSRYRSGRDRALLGGDFFDVAEAPDGRLRVLIGDVCGHGPDEAAIGVCLRAAWRALAVSELDGTLSMSALERVLEHESDIPQLFATLCTLEIEPAQTSASVMLAGHPPPMLIDESAVTVLAPASTGPPIGLAEGHWSPTRLELPGGWVMLLYTDGITDARTDGGEERLGIDGLKRLLSDCMAADPHWRRRPDALLGELIARAEQMNGGELTDDVAMLLIGSRGQRSSGS